MAVNKDSFLKLLTSKLNYKGYRVAQDNPGHAEKSYSMDTIEGSRGPVGVQYLLSVSVNW